ncbi:hypothetical protein V8G54_013562 [Vigna mungo]|uniref:ABC transmembrane type-1 domain-containing protein n=1 Tax=Vigna mungo TaxID=3915 RepID=A0AAQ3NVW8_VIGMU
MNFDNKKLGVLEVLFSSVLSPHAINVQSCNTTERLKLNTCSSYSHTFNALINLSISQYINYWMAWATPVSIDVELPVEGITLIVVYVSLAIGSSLCILARSMLLVTTGYKTATILFTEMHYCIFRAPMSFFDCTPSGRILNRVCKPHSFHFCPYFKIPFLSHNIFPLD